MSFSDAVWYGFTMAGLLMARRYKLGKFAWTALKVCKVYHFGF
jgi:hypothetical protein